MTPAKIFANRVITPVLLDLGLHSAAAVKLLLGTALHESGGLRYVHQDGGPAMGLYQMEPATLKDLFDNFLKYHPDRRDRLERFSEKGLSVDNPHNLYNARYATAAARLQYYRDSEPLPDSDDLRGLAAYYKRVWNTSAGKATEEDFIKVMKNETQ